MSFSAFSPSLRIRVYKCLSQRTLNLIWGVFLFFLIRAAEFSRVSNAVSTLQSLAVLARIFLQEASFRRQISMNCGPIVSLETPVTASSSEIKHTFLISATSRGILAVVDCRLLRIGEDGVVTDGGDAEFLQKQVVCGRLQIETPLFRARPKKSWRPGAAQSTYVHKCG